MQVLRNKYKARYISYDDDAYNLPLDTIYFIESKWNYLLNEFVCTHKGKIEKLLSENTEGLFSYKLEIISLNNLQNPLLQKNLSDLHPEWKQPLDFSYLDKPLQDREKQYQEEMLRRLMSKQPIYEDTFIARTIPRENDDSYDFYSIDISLCTETLAVNLFQKFVHDLNYTNLSIYGENDFWQNCNIRDEFLQVECNLPFGDSIIRSDSSETSRGIISISSGKEIENLQVTTQLRDLAMRIKQEVDTYQRNNGINVLLENKFAEFIKSFEHFEVKPLSSLEINSTYSIRLPEFAKEIKMHTFPKTVYVFFLRHPEGIYLKDISNHREELFVIYKTLTRQSLSPAKAYAKIDGLLDLTNGTLNQYISRISEAFRNELSTDLAKNYIVSGKRNERKRIPIEKFKLILPEKLKF